MIIIKVYLRNTGSNDNLCAFVTVNSTDSEEEVECTNCCGCNEEYFEINNYDGRIFVSYHNKLGNKNNPVILERYSEAIDVDFTSKYKYESPKNYK